MLKEEPTSIKLSGKSRGRAHDDETGAGAASTSAERITSARPLVERQDIAAGGCQ